MKKKLMFLLIAVIAVAVAFTGCASDPANDNTDPNTDANQETNEPVTILVAAAASLEYSYKDELIPMQQQIEAGLEAVVFMSAAMTQMNALVDE